MTTEHLSIPCWIINATNTHLEYVIVIAFPLQQWLQDRASFLRNIYLACVPFVVRFPILYISWLCPDPIRTYC
jgi:hypothetical protein